MNTNTLRPEYAEIAEVHLLALDAGHFDSIPDSIRILELVERCQAQADSANQTILAKLEAAQRLRGDLMQIMAPTVNNMTEAANQAHAVAMAIAHFDKETA